jgi:hypothetical protein
MGRRGRPQKVRTGFPLVAHQRPRGPADLLGVGKEELFHAGREGHGRVGRGDANERRIEVLEALLREHRRDLGADAACARLLVQDDRFAKAR